MPLLSPRTNDSRAKKINTCHNYQIAGNSLLSALLIFHCQPGQFNCKCVLSYKSAVHQQKHYSILKWLVNIVNNIDHAAFPQDMLHFPSRIQVCNQKSTTRHYFLVAINLLNGLWKPEAQCRIHKGSPIIPIPSRINPIPRIDTRLFKVHSNIVLPCTSRPS